MWTRSHVCQVGYLTYLHAASQWGVVGLQWLGVPCCSLTYKTGCPDLTTIAMPSRRIGPWASCLALCLGPIRGAAFGANVDPLEGRNLRRQGYSFRRQRAADLLGAREQQEMRDVCGACPSCFADMAAGMVAYPLFFSHQLLVTIGRLEDDRRMIKHKQAGNGRGWALQGVSAFHSSFPVPSNLC